MNEEIVAKFAEIPRVAIEDDQISSFKDEGDFVGLSVDMLIEAGSYLVTAASVYPSGSEGWTRNEAVIGGSLVRLFKLVDAVLDQTCKHRLETAFILSRLHFETSVNSVFLMRHPSAEHFDNFVSYALQHENRLLSKIEENIALRGGDVLPIEKRMTRSIERTFELSQVDREDLPKKRMRDWQNANLCERAEAVGLGEAYLAVFAGSSQTVHGSWGDLFQHHLEPVGNRFKAKITFKEPRPQFLEVNALHSVLVVSEFVDFLGLYQERAALASIFNDFEDRIRKLSQLHENWLNSR
jgi:hypothetical protein